MSTQGPKQWQSRLAAKIQTPDGQFLLTPVQSIAKTFTTPNTYEDSIEADNVLVTKGNDKFTFNMTVKAVRDEDMGTNPVKVLTLAQLKHLPFSLVEVEKKTLGSNGKNWAFEESLVLENCFVNGQTQTDTPATSPTAVFNCVAGGVSVDGEYYDGTNLDE